MGCAAPRVAVSASTKIMVPLLLMTAADAHIVWNSQWPQLCAGPSLPQDIITRFNVRANAGNAFNGGVVSTMYNHPGSFTVGEWPSFFSNGTAVNGGIPQRGNLDLHLQKVKADVQRLLPDPDFSGYAVIDWEEWQPWLEFWSDPSPAARWSAYMNASYAFAGGDKALAITQWNASALHFMVATLEAARSVRPRGKWGYYGIIGCNGAYDLPAQTCRASERERMDALAPLWRASSALFPTVYARCAFNASRSPLRCDPASNVPQRIRTTIKEAVRQRKRLQLSDTPIAAFTWYTLYNHDCAAVHCPLMRTQADLHAEFSEPLDAGADALVVWGSHGDVRANTSDCATFGSYWQKVLGPLLQTLDTQRGPPPSIRIPANTREARPTTTTHYPANAPTGGATSNANATLIIVTRAVACRNFSSYVGCEWWERELLGNGPPLYGAIGGDGTAYPVKGTSAAYKTFLGGSETNMVAVAQGAASIASAIVPNKGGGFQSRLVRINTSGDGSVTSIPEVDVSTAKPIGAPGWRERAVINGTARIIAWSAEILEPVGKLVEELRLCVAPDAPTLPKTLKSTLLWSHTTDHSSSADVRLGDQHAIDPDSGVLYAQSGGGSIGRFVLHTGVFLPPLHGSNGTELMCMHWGAGGKLGALVTSASGGFSLIDVDTSTGDVSTSRLEIPPPRAGLVPLRTSAHLGPKCSVSLSTGELALLFTQPDASAKYPFLQNVGLHLLRVHTRTTPPSARPLVPISLPLGEPPVGTWRTVDPKLSFLDA